MLETIREYAAERLVESGDADRLRKKHARHYLDLAEMLEDDLASGAEMEEALRGLDAELANLRSARRTLEEAGDWGDSLRLGSAVWRYWMARGGIQEGREWIEQSLAAAEPVAEAARAKALEALGVFAFLEADFPRGMKLSEMSLDLYRRLGDARGTCELLNNLGVAQLAMGGDRTRARALLTESVVLAQSAGDEVRFALARSNLGDLALASGDLPQAVEIAREVIQLQERRGDAARVLQALWLLGTALLAQGDWNGAANAYARGLSRWRASAQLDQVPQGIVGLAAAGSQTGAPKRGRSPARSRRSHARGTRRSLDKRPRGPRSCP